MNTLLVVEDEKLIRQGIVAMIRRSSVPVEEILECRNGEEALEILRKRRVDVMFTDIRMPKMDGLTLVNEMEELSQKPVVIVLSGYDEFSYAVEMMKHGVRDIFPVFPTRGKKDPDLYKLLLLLPEADRGKPSDALPQNTSSAFFAAQYLPGPLAPAK